MLKLPYALFFVAVTFLAWGVYGILLHRGQALMGSSALRSFVGVGIAYFLVAVLVPAFMLSNQKEKGYWSFSGTMMSLFAGSVGALGALGVLLALTFNGLPIYVMPLVFGFAPVVNTMVTMWLGKTMNQMNMIFVVGMLMVALGAVGVLVTKPAVAHGAHSASASVNEKGRPIKSKAKESKSEANAKERDAESEDREHEGDSSESSSSKEKKTNILGVILSIVMAALCWGAYGPFLHIGQMKMGGSRLRPFFCVGVAYFAIAVAAPLALLNYFPDGTEYTFFGMLWSIAAGAAGAVGALGIIMAFNYGGKPIFVMPLVFGFAPVVNTMVNMYLQQTMDQMRPEFMISLGVVVLGAVTVLIFAPKGKPHGAPSKDPLPSTKSGSTPLPPASTSNSSAPIASVSTPIEHSSEADSTRTPEESSDHRPAAESSDGSEKKSLS